MRGVWAALGAMVVAGALSAPANAEPMDAATLEATFSGMSFVGIYEDGSWFSEIYAPDGSISYVDSNAGHDVGEWSVRGNTFCTFYSNLEGVCLTAERISDNCIVLTSPPPTKGQEPLNITTLAWNALQPTTCDIASVATAEPPVRTK